MQYLSTDYQQIVTSYTCQQRISVSVSGLESPDISVNASNMKVVALQYGMCGRKCFNHVR